MKKTIVIADDEPDLLKLVVLRLEKTGYKVISTCDGLKVYDLVKKVKPDLIILDIKLPNENGYEVYARLQKDVAVSHIPVIFATADATVQVEEETERLKADGFLLKPFNADSLLKKMEKILA